MATLSDLKLKLVNLVTKAEDVTSLGETNLTDQMTELISKYKVATDIVKKSGTITGTGASVTIDTGLSTIYSFCLYTNNLTSTGLKFVSLARTNNANFAEFFGVNTVWNNSSDFTEGYYYQSTGRITKGTYTSPSNMTKDYYYPASGGTYYWYAYGVE